MNRILSFAGLIVILCLSGCAGPSSVRHLPRQQWKAETPQNVSMRYFSFQYRMLSQGDDLIVFAEAFPDVTRLPDWASWYGEIVVSVYVSDADGNVLAVAENILTPRSLDREAGLPVEAMFDLGTARHQPLFIAFGYRMTLMDAESHSIKKTLVTEQALD